MTAKRRTERQLLACSYNWMIRTLMGHRWHLQRIYIDVLSTNETKQVVKDILVKYDELQVAMRKRNYD